MPAIKLNFYSTNEPEDYAGKRHGKLTIKDFNYFTPKTGIMWLAQCDCGAEIYVPHLLVGRLKGCGCIPPVVENLETRLYGVWYNMVARCTNPKHIAYKYYGARGISVCDEWKNDRFVFFGWALANGYAADLQIDRIDNYKGYEPSNCRWVTPQEQQKNKRVHQDAREAGLSV